MSLNIADLHFFTGKSRSQTCIHLNISVKTPDGVSSFTENISLKHCSAQSTNSIFIVLAQNSVLSFTDWFGFYSIRTPEREKCTLMQPRSIFPLRGSIFTVNTGTGMSVFVSVTSSYYLSLPPNHVESTLGAQGVGCWRQRWSARLKNPTAQCPRSIRSLIYICTYYPRVYIDGVAATRKSDGWVEPFYCLKPDRTPEMASCVGIKEHPPTNDSSPSKMTI